MNYISMRKIPLYIGVGILLFLVIAYFIPVFYEEVEQGAMINVESLLLGEIIFHNPFVLGLYFLIAIFFIVQGVKNQKNDAPPHLKR